MRKSIADSLQSLPDAELMHRVGQGNQDAYEVLYGRYARKLGGFFLRMLAYDTAKAEDMLQELFVRVWTYRTSYRAAQPFATWLYAMAYNLCKNEYRHEEVRQNYTAGCLLREEPVITMDETIDEELTVPEVARIVGCPEGTVKSRLAAALACIKKQMKMNL